MNKRTLGIAALVVYVSTIFLANLAIVHIGPVSVGFGLVAPAGVYFAGFALLLRDGIQETLGRRWVIAAILVGAALSAWISGPLAIASGIAFLVSESADFGVYTPLRQRQFVAAVVLSQVVGAAVDSAIFLYLSELGMGYFAGQMVGKLWVTLLVLPVLWFRRRRRAIAQ